MNRSSFRFRPLAIGLALASLSLGFLIQGSGAQELPWLPGGRVRFDFAPSFWTWDSRYGLGPTGSEAVELLGSDLAGNPLGSEILPSMVDLEASLAQALGEPSYRVQLGVSQAYIGQSRLVFPLRLEMGITDWLTIGGMAPLVRPRTEISFALDADSNTATEGTSPVNSDATTVIAFLNQMRSALLDAQASHPDEPIVSDLQAYFNALTLAYTHGTFFPVVGSTSGAQLQERLEELETGLSALGVTGMPQTVPLATEYLDEEAFQTFLGSRHMLAFPLEDFTNLWKLGDVELTANVLLLRSGFEPDSSGNLSSLRYQLGGGALVRLGTGGEADPARFFDQDIGDGQLDLEGSVFGLMELGSRFGAWGQIRYGIQNEGEIFRRIAGPSQTLPNFSRTAPVKWTPGNYFEVDLSPRLFLTPEMSFGVRYHSWSKGADSYTLGAVNTEVQDPADLPPADLLNFETEQELREFGISATYSSVEPHARGEASMPLYFRATFLFPISGSGGQTPKGGRFQAGLTIYKTFWGGRRSEEPAPQNPVGR